MTSQSLFASMREFAQATKTVRLAAPEDILSERREWSTDQLALPESQRGEPAKVKLEIRAGAPVMDFAIRSLTMSERQAAEVILDAVVPPEVIMEEPTERPGQPPRRVPAGYNYEDPKYIAALRPLQDRQAAFVVLKGVADLHSETPGADDNSKVQSIMDTLPTHLVKFLAGEIWNMTYAQGDPADFFTSGGSPPSPSSEPSRKPNPPAAKRK